MRLQIMSDLHFEMHADRGAGFVRALHPGGVDVLVLAGDVLPVRQYDELRHVFGELARRYPHIVYVPGNHEYFRSSPDEVAANLARLAKDVPSVAILDNGVVTVAGQRFVGGTMWFRDDPEAAHVKRFMPDFSVIRGFEPWVYERNAGFQATLTGALRAGDVVVTHHLPAPESIAPRFERSPLNAFFLCDQTTLIRERQPALWIHGHTHTRRDYALGATRIVANPLGYPKEPDSAAAFDPAFAVGL